MKKPLVWEAEKLGERLNPPTFEEIKRWLGKKRRNIKLICLTKGKIHFYKALIILYGQVMGRRYICL